MVLGGTRPKDFDKSELKPTRWNSFVEDYAKDHHIPYTEAIVDWRVSNAYRANNNVAWDRKRNVWLKNPEPLRRHFTQEEIARMTNEEVLEAMEEIWESESEEEDQQEDQQEDLVGITLEELENMTNEEVVEELENIAEMEEMAKEDINRVKVKKVKKKKENIEPLTEEQLEEMEEEYEELMEDAERFIFSKIKKPDNYFKLGIRIRKYLKLINKHKEQIGLDKWEEIKKSLNNEDDRMFEFIKNDKDYDKELYDEYLNSSKRK